MECTVANSNCDRHAMELFGYRNISWPSHYASCNTTQWLLCQKAKKSTIGKTQMSRLENKINKRNSKWNKSSSLFL